ncbi:hypothetical protein HID58_020096 [Brassica napus]|uniref:Uncharacterized protein n=3 Tax=Brassica TaxID=3705 RepID=A0ABQ8DEN8_BRANA|nr:hypothetical protein HID58_020096 [Brassica napus]CDY27764.1 BnaA05g31730D [Brassica napus]
MNSRAIYAVIAILAIVISAVNASVGDFGGSLDFVRTGSSSLFSGCKGSIAECIAEEEEMEFDSDISRRILAQKNVALRRILTAVDAAPSQGADVEE